MGALVITIMIIIIISGEDSIWTTDLFFYLREAIILYLLIAASELRQIEGRREVNS